MKHVRVLHENFVNIHRLTEETNALLSRCDSNINQLCLTSKTGNDEWYEGTGRRSDQGQFNKIQKSLNGSYIHQLINVFPKYYRWRLLRLMPGTCYSIHKDGNDQYRNYRIHIPVVVNTDSLLLFFNGNVKNSLSGNANYYSMKPGNTYLFNGSITHTAINGSHEESRIHLVGEKYVRRY